MIEPSDQQYLRQQYKNAANLQARISLHTRFSTTSQNWHRWVFELLQGKPACRVLELGCGPGTLWLNNQERIPPDWQITLSDFSAGMLDEARTHLSNVAHAFHFEQIDAQAIPYPDQSFDMVIANHMLYHVPDRARALAEIYRVLAPTGSLYAATNTRAHMQEIWDLVRQIFPTYTVDQAFKDAFSLESGIEQLERVFTHVMVHRLENALVITEAQPLIAYINSGIVQDILNDAQQQKLRALIEGTLKEQGAIRSNTTSGVLAAQK